MPKEYFIRNLRYHNTQRSYLISLPKELIEAFEWDKEDRIMIQPEIKRGVFTQRFIIKNIDKRPHAMITQAWFDHWKEYTKDDLKLKKRLSTHSKRYIKKRRTAIVKDVKFQKKQKKASKSPKKVKFKW